VIAYLDSSAFVKLVREEDETAALVALLHAWPQRASSHLLRVEVLRAARQVDRTTLDRAAAMVRDVALIPVSGTVLDRAVEIDPAGLRSLDAIHLATALRLGEDLGVLVSYDARLLDAARTAGVETAAPGWAEN
jgi:predicted nucleic acid-binding protein